MTTRICSNGHPIASPDFLFCQTCGAQASSGPTGEADATDLGDDENAVMLDSAATGTSEGRVLRTCLLGHLTDPDGRFCGECGTALVSVESVDDAGPETGPARTPTEDEEPPGLYASRLTKKGLLFVLLFGLLALGGIVASAVYDGGKSEAEPVASEPSPAHVVPLSEQCVGWLREIMEYLDRGDRRGAMTVYGLEAPETRVAMSLHGHFQSRALQVGLDVARLELASQMVSECNRIYSGDSSRSSASTATEASPTLPDDASDATSTTDLADQWIAQLASVEVSAGEERLAETLRKIQTDITDAETLVSADYASLRPGYWVIFHRGPFSGPKEALRFCDDHGRRTQSSCMGRYLSHSSGDRALQCYRTSNGKLARACEGG